MKKLLLFIFGALALIDASAQETVRGSVKDENGEPLPGATIVLKGTSSYTTADVSGNFSITAAKELPFTLQVNSVGSKTQKVDIYELSPESLDIILKTDNLLDEVVVVGYGEQKRKDITGSIASVPAELK